MFLIIEIYSNNYTQLLNASLILPVTYLDDEEFGDLSGQIIELLNNATIECQIGLTECEATKSTFEDVEQLLQTMEKIIDNYEEISCTGGKIEVDGACECRTGYQENDDGRCIKVSTQPTTNNTTLYIIIAVIALIIILFTFKDKIFGGKKVNLKTLH